MYTIYWWKSLSRVWLCNLMDCSLSGSSVQEEFSRQVLDWVAFPSPRDLTPTPLNLPSLQFHPSMSSQSSRLGFLCYTAASLQLSILHRTIYIYVHIYMCVCVCVSMLLSQFVLPSSSPLESTRPFSRSVSPKIIFKWREK